MKYRVRHRSTYAYAQQVQLSYHALHLDPRDTDGQRVHAARVAATPAPADASETADHFGNRVRFLTLTEPHDRLIVDMSAEVEVRAAPLPETTPPWENVRDALHPEGAFADPALAEAVEFALPSPLATADDAVAAYAAHSFPPGRPLLDAARHLTTRIHRDFRYTPGATGIRTTPAEVLARRRGVCQDFAQLQIAALRAHGLAARYVSGYIRNDRGTIEADGTELAGPEFVGSDASHAWVALFCPGLGWVGLDPTNDLIVEEAHITLAWGRDYRDVSPISGILVGGGAHTLAVEVAVRAVR